MKAYKRMVACSIFLLWILWIPHPVSAQSEGPPSGFWNRVSLGAHVHSGNMLRRESDILRIPNADGHQFKRTNLISLELGWQSRGRESWECASKCPVYGVGVSKLNFVNRTELGSPWTIYGFYRGYALRAKKWDWQYKFGFGGSWGWNKDDPSGDIENEIIGSDVNGYVELNTTIGLRVSDVLHLETGLSLFHHSNGNSKLPQKGVNIVALSVGARYSLVERQLNFEELIADPFEPKNEIYGYLAYGPRQVNFNWGIDNARTETHGLNYVMANMTLGFNRHISYRIKLGGGIDMTYDGTTGAFADFSSGKPEKGEVPFGHKLGFSTYAGMEWTEGPLAVVFNMGYDVFRKDIESIYPRFYQRLGFKYHYTKNLFAGLNIRAVRFHVAKYIEWHAGVRKDLN